MVTLCTTCTMYFFFNYEVACPLRVILYSVAHTFQSILGISCGLYHVFIWIIFIERDNLRQSDFFFLIFNAAIHEFPEDLFTNRQRTQGAVLLHIFAVGELCVRTSINVKPCSPVDLVIQDKWCLSENFMTIINTLSALCIIYDWLPLGSRR